MKSRYDKYACPTTHRPLHLKDHQLETTADDSSYPINDGIPCFLRYPSSESPEVAAQLDELIRIARQDGWRAALEKVYASDPSLRRYVTDKERAAFTDLFPLSLDSDVLEIGPGLGQL